MLTNYDCDVLMRCFFIMSLENLPCLFLSLWKRALEKSCCFVSQSQSWLPTQAKSRENCSTFKQASRDSGAGLKRSFARQNLKNPDAIWSRRLYFSLHGTSLLFFSKRIPYLCLYAPTTDNEWSCGNFCQANLRWMIIGIAPRSTRTRWLSKRSLCEAAED